MPRQEFEWTFGEDEAAAGVGRGRVRGPFWFMAAAVLAVLLLLLLWRGGQQQMAQTEAALAAQVQTALNELRAAQAAGDRERFWALLDDDPAWQAGQLQPTWQAFYGHELSVTRAQPYQSLIQANVQWTENGRIYHRLLFFREERGLPRLAAAPLDYWGQSDEQRYAWGSLRYGAADAAWVDALATFVARQVDQHCLAPCPRLTVRLQPDWAETAVPHTIYVPSPRLVAVDEQGQPGPAFWQLLADRLADRMAPTIIHFAVPETAVPLDYERLAA
jgi:hypothetical protein